MAKELWKKGRVHSSSNWKGQLGLILTHAAIANKQWSNAGLKQTTRGLGSLGNQCVEKTVLKNIESDWQRKSQLGEQPNLPK